MSDNQSTLENFLKRKICPGDDGEDRDAIPPRRDGTASNISPTAHHTLRISRKEVNWDELPYDPADRRKISDYIGQKLQDEVRRKYLTRGRCKPPPGFNFSQTIIAGVPRRCQHEWFTTYDWLEYSEKLDKCFCLYCYLFRDCNEGQGRNDAFLIDGWKGYNNIRRLRDHEGTKCDSFHNKTLKSLSNLFPEIIGVLQYVEKEGPNDGKRRQARGLLDYLKDFDFVFHLHLMLLILGHANSLSLSLQRKDKDILEAMIEVKLTKQKFQQIRDDGWKSLLETIYSFCEEHGIPKLDMEEDYIDRHKPRKKTNRTNYDCLNPIIDLQLAEFNDRFDEVNSKLLTQIASFNPKNSFDAYKFESLMELAKSYPEDFDSSQLKDLGRELPIYIDNVRADERFAQLNSISELGRKMVGTNKHLRFSLVYHLLKLVLVLPIATASVERCFSAMKIVKTLLRNRIGDEFLNDCILCFVEQGFLAKIPIDEVIVRFHKMYGHSRREKL